MHQHRLRLAAGLLTFFVGASLTHYLRLETRGCFCASASCRVVFVIDNPSAALLHPLETTELLWNAPWLGD